MDKLRKLGNFNALLAFLVMELLAVTAFSLGGVNEVFFIAAFVLMVFGLLFFYKKLFVKVELKNLLLLLVPVILISAFVSFGNLLSGKSVFTNIATFVGLISFFVLGLISRRNKEFKISTALMSIGFGFALLTLISMIYSWANYGIFHALRYQNTPIYYYNSETFNITKETSWLFGFGFYETTIQYSGFYGVLLTSALFGLFFINPKEDRNKFIITAVIGAIGLIYLLSIPNFKAMLYLIPIGAFAIYIKSLVSPFVKEETKKKIHKISYAVFAVSFLSLIVFFTIVILNISEVLSGQIAGSWLLNKIFNNGRYMQNINIVFTQGFEVQNVFGFVDSPLYFYTEVATRLNTKVFEVEIVKEGGIGAFLILGALFIIAIYSLRRYCRKSKDSPFEKGLLLVTFFAAILYLSLSYEAFPLVHLEETYNSFYHGTIILILLFVLGYTEYPLVKTQPTFEIEEEIKEVIREKSQEYVDDYTFVTEEEEQ